MKKVLSSLIIAIYTLFSQSTMAQTAASAPAQVAPKPYDEEASAKDDIAKGLAIAKANNKHVLIVFGANWCPDCIELDKALKAKSADLMKSKFEIVKVDVGRFNKNTDIANAYGNPIKKGIPAAVIVRPDNSLVYASVGGELSNARRMGEQGVYDFFSDLIKRHLPN